MDQFSMLEEDEGLSLTIYKDTLGYWTLGIGHLVTKDPSKANAIAIIDKQFGRSTGGKITQAEAMVLFQQDVAKAVTSIAGIPALNSVYKSLDDTRKMAIVNMVFQMGAQGVASFSNSLKLLGEKQFTQAATNLAKSKWCTQTPNRAKRVISVLQNGNLSAYNK